MNRATILGYLPNTRTLIVQDHEGQKHLFTQGKEIPEDEAQRFERGQGTEFGRVIYLNIQADLVYPPGFEKRDFEYDGDLPKVLRIHDGGGVTMFHEYNYVGLHGE